MIPTSTPVQLRSKRRRKDNTFARSRDEAYYRSLERKHRSKSKDRYKKSRFRLNKSSRPKLPDCDIKNQYLHKEESGWICKTRTTSCGSNKWLRTREYRFKDNVCEPYTTKCNGRLYGWLDNSTKRWLDNSTKSSQSDATCRPYTTSCPNNGFLDNSTKSETSDATCISNFLEGLTCEWKERGEMKKGTCIEFASSNYINDDGKQQTAGENSSIP